MPLIIVNRSPSTTPKGMMNYRDLETFAGSPNERDEYIDWKAGSIAVLKHYRTDTITRGAHMQRQFTIELRVDFADQEKLEPLKEAIRAAAKHVNATALLISDNPKSTQIAIYSEDFFTGNEEIKLLDDTIAQGLAAANQAPGDEGVSSELSAAITDGV